MSDSRLVQVWLGLVGIVAGATILLSGLFTAEKARANDEGISITIVSSVPSK